MIPLGILAAAPRATSPPEAASAWDPAVKGGFITLSNAGYDAETGENDWNSVYGTKGRDSGKYAFEVIFLAGTNSNSPFASIADKTNTENILSSYAGNTGPRFESVGYWGNSRTYWNYSSGSGYQNHSQWAAPGDVITVAVDMAELEINFFRNGLFFAVHSIPAGKTWFPVASLQQGARARLVTRGLTHLPAGFSEWG